MKQLRIALLVLLSCIAGLLTHQFLFCPRYQFNPPRPFAGSHINNPYDSMDVRKWVKCNFHAHAHSWGGITNGHGSADHVHRAYENLHYGVHCVSNYHNIDTSNAKEVNYLSAYEHGYNMLKTHQLVLGSKTVKWLDYLLPQTVHNKQHLLKTLRETGTVTILNHPALRNGYTSEDLAQIVDYDCVEVLNPSVTSTAEWDAALSAGRTAFIVGDDDIHDVISKRRLGTRCTFVNVNSSSSTEVLHALKTGKSYGVIVGARQHYDSIPYLRSLTVRGDSIHVVMSTPAQMASITGQGGKLLVDFRNTARLSYRIKPTDHYARATFQYDNGTTVFLNPVYYSAPGGHVVPPVTENFIETIFFRILGVCSMLLWLWFGRWWMSPKPPTRGGQVKRRREDYVLQE
ncbi:hypothetical protein LZD49_07005 [Dyadobacter sp. CY261]|uniref:hypothetical protein n=1 Tax=Dyadobacter sp. CY261 TaxID=2907203 RepID=UPI001F3273E7|nr:hypothetical protein [Dyadobacter sp. CY261]MCF0070214.1 hypothetical protein [Dyadobacter sp. CY261]